MNKKIWLSPPHMGGEEMAYVREAMEQNWISPAGPHLEVFEKQICGFTGAKFATALNSGTSALHLALILKGVQEGDEVLCSTFTFCATVNAIRYQNAVPVFVESESSTWNMCPDTLEHAIKDRMSKGKKPKAILVVHIYGMPSRMDEIMTLSSRYDIPVIEDASESMGSTYKNMQTGTIGDIGVYSFNGNKIITTSGGGALVSGKEKYNSMALYLATQARKNAPYYEHHSLGFNYRMSNIAAAIGIGQMKVLEERVERRRQIFELYHKELAGLEGVGFLMEPDGFFSNRWLTCMTLEKNNISAEDVRLCLEREQIEARPLWIPMHKQPVFKDFPYYGSGYTETLCEKGLCLPSGSNLSNDDIFLISSLVRKKLTF